MQALFILMVWASMLAMGFVAPFVVSLAYIWVDIFQPQSVAPTIATFQARRLQARIKSRSVERDEQATFVLVAEGGAGIERHA